jgi:glyoxylase-like metal-dependent hydrolase (beta-lactamase superfamily II)
MHRAARYAAFTLAGLALLGAVSSIAVLRTRRSASSAVQQVAPGIHHVRNFLSDVYAARAGDDVLLFDAGMDPEGHAVDDLLRALGATREQVKHVFLSHGHFDHIAAANLFPHARIHLGQADVTLAARGAPARPLTPWLFGALAGSAPVEVNAPLEGRRRIDVSGGDPVLALPFPGHTPGSYLYLFRHVLFTGDSIQLQAGALAPAEAAHSVDPLGNRTSISRLPYLLGYERVDYVCTGHRWCTAEGSARTLLTQLLASVTS